MSIVCNLGEPYELVRDHVRNSARSWPHSEAKTLRTAFVAFWDTFDKSNRTKKTALVFYSTTGYECGFFATNCSLIYSATCSTPSVLYVLSIQQFHPPLPGGNRYRYALPQPIDRPIRRHTQYVFCPGCGILPEEISFVQNDVVIKLPDRESACRTDVKIGCIWCIYSMHPSVHTACTTMQL